MSEKEIYTAPETKSSDPDEVEIDWMGYLRKLIAARKALLWAVVVGAVLGVVVAFSIPKEYTVNVTLVPEMDGDSKSSGGLASLASSFLGSGAVSAGGDALNTTLSADIVVSTPFVLELFDVRVQTLDNSLDTTFVAYLDEQKSPWWNAVLGLPGKAVGWAKSLFADKTDSAVMSMRNPFQLSQEEFQKISTIRSSVVANVDTKTAITTLSVTLQDPKVAALIADSVVQKLQTYYIGYRISKAESQYAYLSKLYDNSKEEYYALQKKLAMFSDANRNLSLQRVEIERERLRNEVGLAYQIYSQVATQLQMTRAKIQETKPCFIVLEPPTVPIQPSGTGRKTILIAFVFVAVVLTAGWKLLGEDLVKNIKKSL